ncbi:Protein YIPF6 [Porphyridium purpureum]|uniref:Protein YIPF n=1 Tax=Porphyridium purpureum TaxID=35688 RepID=A0A5J4YZP8_PORPP|nr:Protein YIPF6 [Porphyridium purpureum]|eukprot:POR4355..scf208_2
MEPSADGDFTIDESVAASVFRDIALVARRMGLVFLPGLSSLRAELRDWELWGPLFICMSLAVILSVQATDAASVVFSIVFLIVWVGSAIVTMNAQLLGARISFFQTVCLLGYCVFPLLISSSLCLIFNHFLTRSLAVVLRFSVVAFSILWSILAAGGFLSDAEIPPGKLGLALYPVVLFFFSIGWLILLGFQQDQQTQQPQSGPAVGAGSQASPTPAA